LPYHLLATPRMAGDGLDYRRPMNTTSQGASELDIIDLTNEPESPPQVRRQQGASNSSRAGLPRFERNILNDAPQEIVNLDDDEADDDHGEGPSSPDVLFVGESTRPRPPRRRWFPLNNIFANIPSLAQPASNPTGARGLLPPTSWIGNPPLSGRSQDFDTLIIGDPLDFDLDYELPSFSMGPSSRPAPRERDTYKAPAPPSPGFTRTIAELEEGVAVCPHCDRELGTGDGKQQEIWVAKPCGHVRDYLPVPYQVYCGECAENRSKAKAKSKKANGAQKPRIEPFSKCRVEGCNKQISAPTAMIHLFL
ncbi:hypothetical protein N7470_008842, partial [Penicillium chermesinum]